MKKKTVIWDPTTTSAENARLHLPELARKFFAAGRKATRKDAKTKVLHQFRLEVKRFRYTLELFQPIYGKKLGELLAVLRRAQMYLGVMNDCAITRDLILAAGSRKSPVVKELLNHLKQTEKAKAREFLEYWQNAFADQDEETRWIRYLKSFAGRVGRSHVPLSS